MYATAWHNGGDPSEPSGYGLKFTARDRDKYFDRAWDEVVLRVDGDAKVSIQLSRSFWRSCSELRSAGIGSWLLTKGAAPWSKGSPPGVSVTVEDGNLFRARVIEKKRLPGHS